MDAAKKPTYWSDARIVGRAPSSTRLLLTFMNHGPNFEDVVRLAGMADAHLRVKYRTAGSQFNEHGPESDQGHRHHQHDCSRDKLQRRFDGQIRARGRSLINILFSQERFELNAFGLLIAFRLSGHGLFLRLKIWG